MLRTLNNRLHFLLFLVALPGLLAVGFQLMSERSSAIDRYRAESSHIAQDLAGVQQRIVEETRLFLEQLARVPVLQDPSHPACGAYLERLLPLTTHYVNLGAPGANGDLLCNATPLPGPVNVADRPYIREALDQRRFAIGTFQMDRAMGLPSLNFAVPIQPDGAEGPVVGAAVAVVSLAWWNERLSRQDMPDDTIALVVDSTGTIIAHYPLDLNLLGRAAKDVGLSCCDGVTHSEASGEHPMPALVDGTDNQRRAFARRVLMRDGAGVGLNVVVGVPVEASLTAANRAALVRALLLIFGVMLAWSLAIGLMERDVLRPLAALSAGVRALERGQRRESEQAASTPIKEFSSINQQVETMAGARRAAEEAEQRRERQLDAVLDALPDLYFRLDGSRRVLECRAADRSQLLVPPERFMGQAMDSFLPPEASALFIKHMDTHADTREVVTWEYSLEIGGEMEEFEARACPVKGSDETVLVVRNISERKRAERGVRLSSLIYENSSEGMIVLDRDLRIATVNPAITRQSGYGRDELIGKRISTLIVKEDRARLKRQLRMLEHMQGPFDPSGPDGWSGELRLRRAQGGEVPVWLSINRIESGARTTWRFVILSRDMTELYRANETIWHQAHFDGLTSLPNRVSLSETLDRALSRARTREEEVALLFLDMDRLKQVNDRLGHSGGDMMLIEVAERLRACVEARDLVARQGGDEFVILLTGPDVRTRSREIGKQVLREVARPVRLGAQEASLSCSLGAAFYPADARDGEALLAAADQAMYAAKERGGNRMSLFSPEIHRDAQDRLHLIDDLREALIKDEFVLHFQPIVDLRSSRIVKAEALIRWAHPRLGLLGPDRFIPLAEEEQLLGPLSTWVVDRACHDLPVLRGRFGKGVQLCLNISPTQLSAQDSCMTAWEALLAGAGLEQGALIAEITEGAILGSNPRVRARLAEMRQMGMQLALDDFGTGYASLQHFLSHEFDLLKIDRSFVRDLPRAPAARVLCETMLDLAGRLDAQVIAEGIETYEQRAYLSQTPGVLGQGFLFSPPVPLDQFLALPRRFPPV